MSHPFRPLFVEVDPVLTRVLNTMRIAGHPPLEASHDDLLSVAIALADVDYLHAVEASRHSYYTRMT